MSAVKTYLVLFLVLLLTKVETSDGQADAKDQKDFLKIHNYYRELHGSPPLHISDKLNRAAEICAKRYAFKQTIREHFCNPPGTGTGENLYMIWVSGPPTPNNTFVVQDSVRLWYDEIKDYDYSDPGNVKPNVMIGHFTQVIWNASTELGLGISTYGMHTVVVGKYKPPGNVIHYDRKNQYKYYHENVLPLVSSASSAGEPLRFIILFSVINILIKIYSCHIK